MYRGHHMNFMPLLNPRQSARISQSIMIGAALTFGNFIFAVSSATAGDWQIAPAITSTVKLTEHQRFCSRLQQTFTAYGKSQGMTALQTTRLAEAASHTLVDGFRDGRVSDYVNVNALREYAGTAIEANETYIPLASFIGGALGIAKPVTLALSAGELRFIPFAQRGMELVVISRDAMALTPPRARKVAQIAKSQGIKIHVVWTGSTLGKDLRGKEGAQTLLWLASNSGGTFADLSGPNNPCGTLL